MISAALISSVAAQCEIKPGKAVKADAWDDVFIQYGPGKGLEPAGQPGWTGGDSTISLRLKNGDSAFFFSDSYIGEAVRTKRDGTVDIRDDGARVVEINCGPPYCGSPAADFTARNSIVILSKDGKTLRTFAGKKNDQGLSTSYFPEPAAERYFWMGDPVILPNGKIAAFLHKFDPKLEFHGTSIAEIDPKTFVLEGIREMTISDLSIHWGSSVMEEKGYLYVYGKGTRDGKKLPFIARTRKFSSVPALMRSSDWQAWNGKQWTSDLSKAAPIVDQSDSISDEFTVRRFSVNGRSTLIMSALDSTVPFHEWKDITLYSACDPQGPFIGKHRIYSMPESAAKTVWGTKGDIPLKNALVVYNPHIHKQFTDHGRLLISYNTNRIDDADTIYIDGYRPRFIYVPVEGLK